MFKNIYIWIFKLLFLIIIILWAIIILHSSDIVNNIWMIFWEQTKNFIIFFVIIFEFLFLMIFIDIIYEKPIKNLSNSIKYFLSWEKWYENFLKTSLNWNINFITSFFKQVIYSLKWIKDEFFHWKEIKWEVSIAKEIQWKMLWKKIISVPSLNVIFTSKPAWEIWWDSYDIIKSDDNENYYIYVWDATWHWVWAWFIMTMVNALIEWFTKSFKSWADILAKTNLVLKPRVKTNLLMSLLLVRWNENEKKLFMTWAWHEYLIIYKQNLKKTFKIKSGWVALWMVKDISKVLKEVEIKVEPGDIIVLYSDWVTEAINRPKKDWTEQLFWENRLIEAVQNAPEIPWKWHKSSISVYKNITIELSKFMGYKYTQLDDITLWVIQYKPENFEEKSDFSPEIEPQFITEWKW